MLALYSFGRVRGGENRWCNRNPNAEIRMSKKARIPKSASRRHLKPPIGWIISSEFGIRICFGFRHSDFVIIWPMLRVVWEESTNRRQYLHDLGERPFLQVENIG